MDYLTVVVLFDFMIFLDRYIEEIIISLIALGSAGLLLCAIHTYSKNRFWHIGDGKK